MRPIRKHMPARCIALGALLASLALLDFAGAKPSFSRTACPLTSVALMLYTSGLSPGSPASARCERCIVSYAASRLEQGDNTDTFYAFNEKSVLSCHAVYLASVTSMRETCIDCEAEIEAIREALENPENACSTPMQKAIELGKSSCARITLDTVPLGPKVAAVVCELKLVEALRMFFNSDTKTSGNCVASLEEVQKEAEEKKRHLGKSEEIERIDSEGIPEEFDEIEGLVLGDMLAAMDLTLCYAVKPYSLADQFPGPYCGCLTDGGTDRDPSPALAGAVKVFQATDLTTYGVRSLIRESLRSVLIDTAKCYNLPDNTFLKSNSSRSGTGATPSTSPSPRPDRFNAPDPNPSCLSGHSLVYLEDGSVIPVRMLRVGDRVQVGPHEYDDVFMFTHTSNDVVAEFLQIHLENGVTISVTPGHYVYVNDELGTADSVRPGDEMIMANNQKSSVRSIHRVEERGVFNPQTIHGDIVVNGVLISTYTSAISPKLAHAALSLPRILYRFFGVDFFTMHFNDWTRSALVFLSLSLRRLSLGSAQVFSRVV